MSADKGDSELGSYYQRLLDSVMQNLLDGIITIDIRGFIQTINPAVEKLTGYTESELVGKNVNMLMDQHIASIHDSYLVEAKDSEIHGVIGNKRYLKIRRKDGSHVHAEITVSKMHFEDELIFIGSIYDVTDKIEQEKKIWELARFPEETWNPVLKISETGIIDYANTRCDAILRSWATKINMPVPDDVLAVIKNSIDSGMSGEIEVSCEDENNKPQYFKLLIAPVLDLKSVYVYGLDITQAKKDKKELLEHRNLLENMVSARTDEAISARMEAERASAAKSQFLANMSHEIRTPLSSIIGYSEMLMEEQMTEVEKRQTIQTIVRSSHHLKEIINDILDLSKIEADKIELENISFNLFDLFADIESLIKPLFSEKNLVLNIDYIYPLPKRIQADPLRLKQIILNLCSNAIKFTDSGRVEIKIEFDRHGNQLRVYVIDTGIGMSDEQLDKIFAPFEQADPSTTRKYGGTGLGLCLSSQLARLMGGDLRAESEVGKGTSFKLLLPLSDIHKDVMVDQIKHEKAIYKTDDESKSKKLNGCILLVDDTQELQLLVSAYLKKFGLLVDVVSNGEEAVNSAMQKDYDAILLDMQMPVMDGYTAVKLLRSRGYSKPVIALTANAMQEDRDRCLSLGCNEYLAKPVQRTDLFNMLDRYLSSSSGDIKNPDEQLNDKT